MIDSNVDIVVLSKLRNLCSTLADKSESDTVSSDWYTYGKLTITWLKALIFTINRRVYLAILSNTISVYQSL